MLTQKINNQFDDFALRREEQVPRDCMDRTEIINDCLQVYYGHRYLAASIVQPKRIFEIGPNNGYAGLMFLKACPSAAYVAVDLNQGTDGGVVGYYQHARKILAPYNAHIHLGNSRDLRKRDPNLFDPPLPLAHMEPIYDLVNIDADHSREGAYYDIVTTVNQLAAPGAGWILMDDLINCNDRVGYAVLQAAREGIFSGALFLHDLGGQLLVPPHHWHREGERRVDPIFVKMVERWIMRRDWTLYPHFWDVEA